MKLEELLEILRVINCSNYYPPERYATEELVLKKIKEILEKSG